jgi:hypothetical protein
VVADIAVEPSKEPYALYNIVTPARNKDAHEFAQAR